MEKDLYVENLKIFKISRKNENFKNRQNTFSQESWKLFVFFYSFLFWEKSVISTHDLDFAGLLLLSLVYSSLVGSVLFI